MASFISYQVCPNGASVVEAFLRLRNRSSLVVLMDCQMPGVNGLVSVKVTISDFAQVSKQLDKYAKLKLFPCRVQLPPNTLPSSLVQERRLQRTACPSIFLSALVPSLPLFLFIGRTLVPNGSGRDRVICAACQLSPVLSTPRPPQNISPSLSALFPWKSAHVVRTGVLKLRSRFVLTSVLFCLAVVCFPWLCPVHRALLQRIVGVF